MKKLIVGLMGLMMVGAMALPVAAQGRDRNRNNQETSRRDNDRRDNSGSSWRDEGQRNDRFSGRRGGRDEFDTFGRSNRWQQGDRDDFRFNGREVQNHNRRQRH